MTNINTTSTPLKLLMAFAIFWMVIGELITYHQKVMFGVDLFGNHHPFTKPKHGDDGGVAQFKPLKHLDKSDDGQLSAMLFIPQQDLIKLLSFFSELRSKSGLQILQPALLFFSGLRAPPSF